MKNELKPEELKNGLMSGAINVIKNRERLNRINVFPVPDGDTGSNLAQTFRSVIQTLKNREYDSAYSLLQEVSRNMLKSARGNSGVIFSQFFYSFSRALKGKRTVSIADFSKSMKLSIKKTYEAIEKPVEGTVLTVIREVSEEAVRISERVNDFKEFLDHLQKVAKKSLERTRESLPQLKKARVVDAGGLGFLYFLQGLSMYFQNEPLDVVDMTENSVEEFRESYETGYRYCTEVLLRGSNMDLKGIKERLKDLGDSLLVVGDESLLHIHIHTDEPEKVFEILSGYGEIEMRKADDMHKQVKEKHDFAFLVDSGMDLTPYYYEEYNFRVIPFQVIYGGRSYREGVDITREDVMKILTSERWRDLKTSQPAFSDYLDAYKELTQRAKKVYAIHISSNFSGTYASSVTASKKFENVTVFDTKLFSIAAGLMALRIRDMVIKGSPDDVIKREIERIRRESFAVIVLDTMKNLVHGGRAGKLRGKLVDLLGFKVIITIDEDGYLKKLTQAFGADGAMRKVFKLLKDRLDHNRVYDFGIAHVNTPERVKRIREFIESNFRYRDIIVNYTTPAIAVYGGPGAYGVFAVPVEGEFTRRQSPFSRRGN